MDRNGIILMDKIPARSTAYRTAEHRGVRLIQPTTTRSRKFDSTWPDRASSCAIAGAKDRATKRVSASVVPATDGRTLQGFVCKRAEPGAKVYTDDTRAYRGMAGFDHEAVNHSVGEYVRAQAHTNGIESFWAILKRGYHGTFHHFSAAHMQRYINEFAARQGLRERDTIAIMGEFVAGMIGRRLTYRQLTGKVGA